MECSPIAEPAYLNLPGWRCVPVYAFPHSSSNCKTSTTDLLQSSLDARSLMPSNIPHDPKVWTRKQVYSWLEWCIDNFCLPPLDVEQFYMNGRGLCLLKKTDWRDRAPRSGDILYNALQVLLQRHKSDSYNCNPPTENISAALLHHAALHDKNLSQQIPNHMWQRSISSDMHSMGHLIHENEHINGISMSNMNGGSDVESPTAGSPAPSPDGPKVPHETNGYAKNNHLENGTVSVTTNTSVTLPQMPQVTQYNEGAPENVVEKINVRLLWDFLQQLLNDHQQRYNSCIVWKDKPRRVFKITDPHRLAGLWGKQKNHLNMNFDKMSRALRYYYRVRILQKEPGEKHCYRFLRHPNELRHCKQRSLLSKETGLANTNSIPLESSDTEAVLDMSIKEEGCSPGDAD